MLVHHKGFQKKLNYGYISHSFHSTKHFNSCTVASKSDLRLL